METNKYIVNGKTIIGNVAVFDNENPKEILTQFHAHSLKECILEELIKSGLTMTNDIIEEVTNCAFNKARELYDNCERLGFPDALKDILTVELSKKEQVALLKGVSLSTNQIDALLIFAGNNGYKLSQYRHDIIPTKYKSANIPKLIFRNEDGKIEHTGTTHLTDGQLKEILESSNFTLCRILSNEKHWHCFFQTKLGIYGKEHGDFGNKSHLHYVSDAFGLKLEDVIKDFKQGKCPHSNVHIVLID